jgi:hypothetical protein
VSQPFIVKTNENQWEESEGTLLRIEAFGDATETLWCKFANALQKRYIAATKQDIQAPLRPLFIQDLNYLYQLKFSSFVSRFFSHTLTLSHSHLLISSFIHSLSLLISHSFTRAYLFIYLFVHSLSSRLITLPFRSD